MDPEPATPASTPYRDAAHTYRAAGWVGVLPIPYRTKRLRAVGWTGHAGAWPSGADIQEWVDSDRPDHGGGNIALRLPPDVLGIDVDNYDGKHGADTLADAVAAWGHLPATWMSSARDDGISKIRLFRIPEGLRWPGELGPHVELIQTRHRYMMVWPSVHPGSSTYRWYRPDGMPSLAVPRVGELPALPDRWVAGLTGGELAEDVHIADLTLGEVSGWIDGRPGGQPCRGMQAVLQHLLDDLDGASAHDALKHLMAVARFAEQGHTGLKAAIGEARTAFVATVTDPSRGRGSIRTTDDALAEFLRSLTGAVRRVRGDASVADDDTPLDPCEAPFADLVDHRAGADTFTPPALTAAPALTPLQTRQQQHDDHHGDTEHLDVADEAAAFLEHGDTHSDDTPPAGAGTGPGSDTGDGHTTWRPLQLGDIITGEHSEPEPAVLARADGHHLFYAGKVNGLLGESESGKSWILLAAAVQLIEAGHPVLYLDFEDTAASVVARLLAMGAKPADIVDLLHYIAPDESLHPAAALDLAGVLEGTTYRLIGLDGVNAAMTLLGLDLQSNTDATKFAQKLLKPLAATGAAVVTVDHVGKNAELRGKGGIGAQAKRAMVTGAAYTVEVLSPFGRGQTGKLKLTVDKDRPGHVRGFAENSKNAGIATLESGSNGSVNVRVDPAGTVSVMANRTPFRPTGLMEKISRLLSTTDGMLGQNQIEQHVGGKASTIRAALDCLVEEGFVSRHPGPRNSIQHRYEKTFRELSELADPTTGGDDW